MELTRANLEPLACWFDVDRAPYRPEVTEFKRRARLHQAQWRESKGWPMGAHGRGRDIPNGSRLQKDDGDAYRNFLSDNIRDAVRDRLQAKQKGQQLREDRLLTDLLSSMPMCFNLFGDLYGDAAAVAKAGQALWGIQTEGPAQLHFEWSPGRHQKQYTGDGTAFDAAFVFGSPNRPRQIVGVETKYHEHSVREKTPDLKQRLPRYREIVEAAGIFPSDWDKQILNTDLQQIWRDHLLLLSMLQSEDTWTGGKYVLVHPSRNPSFADAGKRYRDLLTDTATFEVTTIEELLEKRVLHGEEVHREFEARYLW